MNKISRIPAEIHYFYSMACDSFVGSKYDPQYDVHWKRDPDKFEKVYSAFPVLDINDTKKVEEAKRWAARYDHQTQTYSVVQTLSIKNEAISLKLHHITHRASSGVYKVVHTIGNTPFLFDLREDVVVDALLHEGCKEGQFLCKFVWGKLGAQTRLIRIGSKLYNDFMNI